MIAIYEMIFCWTIFEMSLDNKEKILDLSINSLIRFLSFQFTYTQKKSEIRSNTKHKERKTKNLVLLFYVVYETINEYEISRYL